MSPRRTSFDRSKGVIDVEWPFFGELSRGLALKVSVMAEIFGVTTGIGYVMNYSREILATQMVFVWALVMILVMMATDTLLFDTLTRRLTRWR